MLFSIPNFPDSNGIKIIKYPLNELYVVYIGTNSNEIHEITICKKKKDKDNNIFYEDLLTKSIYQTSSKQNEVIALKEFTLTSMLNEKDKIEILKKGFINNEELIDLYSSLNEDNEYHTKYGIYYPVKNSFMQKKELDNVPSFINDFKCTSSIIEDNEDSLATLIMSIKTNKKTTIIIGDKGSGKTQLIHKLYHYAHLNPISINKQDITTINYNNMLENTFTLKHIKNRINKTFDYLKETTRKILIIDDVNFTNNYFINTIIEESKKNNIKLILIATNRKDLNTDELNENDFEIIKTSELKRKTKKLIIESWIEENYISLAKDKNEIISIILDCDETSSINDADYIKNPLLGINILSNALTIANIENNLKEPYSILEDIFRIPPKTKLKPKHFIEALELDNIKMDPTTKKVIKERLQNLEEQRKEKKNNNKIKKYFSKKQ